MRGPTRDPQGREGRLESTPKENQGSGDSNSAETGHPKASNHGLAHMARGAAEGFQGSQRDKFTLQVPSAEVAYGPTSPPLAYSMTKQRRSWVWNEYFRACNEAQQTLARTKH